MSKHTPGPRNKQEFYCAFVIMRENGEQRAWRTFRRIRNAKRWLCRYDPQQDAQGQVWFHSFDKSTGRTDTELVYTIAL